MTEANETAFPFQPTNEDYSNNYGLTKRELFAAMAMQGILAANEQIEYGDYGKRRNKTSQEVSEQSLWYADALLTQLSQNKTP